MSKTKERFLLTSDIKDIPMSMERRKFWEAIGLTAAVLNILVFVPPVIQLAITPDPTKGATFAIPLYVTSITSNVFWLPYGIAIHSLPIVITSVVTIVLAIAFIIMTYTLRSSSSSNSS